MFGKRFGSVVLLGMLASSGAYSADGWYGQGPRWIYESSGNINETMYVGNLQTGGEGFSIAFGWGPQARPDGTGGMEIWPRTSFLDKVYIGSVTTKCASCKLAVDGIILAKEIQVQTTIAAKNINVGTEKWADNVFDKNYDLMPLPQVSKFIEENKRLPGMPSESEVLANGIDMGDMTRLLLEKVEELTLHVIELDNENQKLRSEVSALTK